MPKRGHRIPSWQKPFAILEYDDQKPITLTGKVTKVSPDNPHGWIYLDVKNANGRVIGWALELPPPNVLYRNGSTPLSTKRWRRTTRKSR